MTSRGLSIRSITVASVLAGALALAMSSTAMARGGGHGGGGHGGGGHGGGHGGFHGGFHGGGHVAHFSGGRHFSSHVSSHSHASRSFVSRHGVAAGVAAGAAGAAIVHNNVQGNHVSDRVAAHNANAVHNALVSHQVTNALHSHGGLRDPASRAAITAEVAHGAWHNHGGGWWRHYHGGYGWVGPVFWPYAYWDMYDYAFWGYGYDPAFWDYGYADLYGGLFGMYDYGALSGYAGYLPRRGGGTAAAPAPGSDQATLADMCGDDTRDIAGLPVDRIRDTLQLNDDQRAALDLLATASQNASQSIRNSCPGDVALTAPARLATMQQRVQAMRTAVNDVTPALDKFYSLLTDEQKAKFNGMAAEQPRAPRETPATTASTGNCDTAQPGATDWPGALIESNVRPTDAQRTSLAKLQEATNKAAEILKTSCQPTEARTPPARFEAIAARLDTMDKAIGTVRPALDEFYNSLSDEQKAAFDAIGPQRSGSTTAAVSDDDGTGRHRHHRHGVSVGRMIRHMIGFM